MNPEDKNYVQSARFIEQLLFFRDTFPSFTGLQGRESRPHTLNKMGSNYLLQAFEVFYLGVFKRFLNLCRFFWEHAHS